MEENRPFVGSWDNWFKELVQTPGTIEILKERWIEVTKLWFTELELQKRINDGAGRMSGFTHWLPEDR